MDVQIMSVYILTFLSTDPLVLIFQYCTSITYSVVIDNAIHIKAKILIQIEINSSNSFVTCEYKLKS